MIHKHGEMSREDVPLVTLVHRRDHNGTAGLASREQIGDMHNPAGMLAY